MAAFFLSCTPDKPPADTRPAGTATPRAAAFTSADRQSAAALIRAAYLGHDWRRGDLRGSPELDVLADQGIGLGFAPCGATYEPSLTPVGSMAADFQVTANGPYAIHAVFTFEDDDATAALYEFVDQLEWGGECVARNGARHPAWTLHGLWMRDDHGDEMAAYSLHAQDGPGIGRLLLIRRANMVSTLLELDPQHSEHFTEVYSVAAAMDALLLTTLHKWDPSGCAVPGCG
jgi:hypothetical protein